VLEKSNESGATVETPGQPVETQEIASSSPEPTPVAPSRAIRQMAANIRLRKRVIRTFEKQDKEALRDMATRGAKVVEPRCDSNGKPHDRVVPNPSARISREARATINRLRKEIAEIEEALAAALAVPKDVTGLAALAGRAKGLRK
jgi:hypothetical protein